MRPYSMLAWKREAGEGAQNVTLQSIVDIQPSSAIYVLFQQREVGDRSSLEQPDFPINIVDLLSLPKFQRNKFQK